MITNCKAYIGKIEYKIEALEWAINLLKQDEFNGDNMRKLNELVLQLKQNDYAE